MRFSVLTALLLAICALLCAKNSAPLVQNIGVFIDFEDRPSDSTVQAMEREVGAIMRPASLGFTWRDMGMNQDSGSGIFADLMVIKFKGSCSGAYAPMSELGPSLSDDLSLAETKTSHGQVLHFTEVHCDEVRRYLASDVSSLTARRSSEKPWAGSSHTRCITSSRTPKSMPQAGWPGPPTAVGNSFSRSLRLTSVRRKFFTITQRAPCFRRLAIPRPQIRFFPNRSRLRGPPLIG
jgi:hypothetical protein